MGVNPVTQLQHRPAMRAPNESRISEGGAARPAGQHPDRPAAEALPECARGLPRHRGEVTAPPSHHRPPAALEGPPAAPETALEDAGPQDQQMSTTGLGRNGDTDPACPGRNRPRAKGGGEGEA